MKEAIQKLASQDAAFFAAETPEGPMHVGGIQILRKPEGAPADYVRQLADWMRGFQPNRRPFDIMLASTERSFTRPLSKPALGWGKPDKVDMEYHVRLLAVAAPGSDRQVMEAISAIHTQPLDRSRPLWEYHLIDGVSDGRFAIYTKTHHALMDGLAARGLFNFSDNSDERDVPPVWHVTTSGKPDKRRSVFPFVDLFGRYSQAFTHAKAMPEVLGVVRDLLTTARKKESGDLLAPFMAPRSVLNGTITPRRTIALADLSISRCKAIAKQTGTTLNDVFLAVSGGALRRHLASIDSLPDDALVANVPVGLEKKGNEGNAYVTIYATTGSNIEDPLERLLAVSRSTVAGKKQVNEMSADALHLYSMIMMLATPLFAKKLPIKLPEAKKALANVLVSNIPGPPQRFYINGAELLGMYPVSILTGGLGLNITILSYAGNANFGLVSCPDLLPGVADVASHFAAEFDALEAAVQSSAAAKPAPALPAPSDGDKAAPASRRKGPRATGDAKPKSGDDTASAKGRQPRAPATASVADVVQAEAAASGAGSTAAAKAPARAKPVSPAARKSAGATKGAAKSKPVSEPLAVPVEDIVEAEAAASGAGATAAKKASRRRAVPPPGKSAGAAKGSTKVAAVADPAPAGGSQG